ncbi:MAG: PAS domain S-box-containing protein [Chlamydiales bacterium]|jgi:PAS domain S-box-containing protein
MIPRAKKILVVEDEQIVQLHLAKIVESTGHTLVGAVDNAQDALARTRQMNPDLVLMDIRLAGGDDGIECARELTEKWGASIVFITAHSDPETVARAMPIEPAGFLIKPFRAAEVSASIMNTLAARSRERRARDHHRALSSAVESLQAGLLVLDTQGVIGFANPKGKTLSGWTEFEGTDRTLYECVAEHEHDRLRAALARTLSSKSAVALEGVQLVGTNGDSANIRLEPVSDSTDDACLLATINVLTEDGSAHTSPHRDASQPRLLVYSHDTFGLGHIRRCMNVVRALTEQMEDLSTLLVTGSPVAHKFDLPPRTDYLKLPAVRKVAPGAYAPRSLAMSDDGILTLRRNLLLRTIRDYSPNLLLVDHSPTGMNGELIPALDYLRETGGCTRILGLRDIIDSPERVAKRWEQEDMFGVLRRSYDHVVVYGAKSVYDTTSEYGFPEDLRRTVHHVNYVSQRPTQAAAGCAVAPDPKLVVVTIGGGDGGGDSIVRPFLEMLRAHAKRLDIHAEVLLGPFVPDAQREELRELARGSAVVLHDFIPDPTALFARAALVISTAGYNVSAELLAHAQRALLIPRVVHREEQLIRARRLAELGLVDFLHPDDATPDAIAECISAALANDEAALAICRSENRVPLDGAQRMAAFVETLVHDRSAGGVSP